MKPSGDNVGFRPSTQPTITTQENFRVRISDNNAVITKDIGNVTINDNDISQISINDISIREGNRGITNAGMTISLSNPSQERIISCPFN